MSTIVDEGFDGHPLGPFGAGPVGGTIVAGGIEPTPTHSFKSAVVFGGLQYIIGSITDLSIFLSYTPNPGSIFDVDWFDGLGHTIPILSLIVEQDGSLSICQQSNGPYYTTATFVPANTMLQSNASWVSSEFIYIHLHATITPIFTEAVIDVTLKVNETTVCTGTQAGFNPSIFFNLFNYTGPPSAILDNLTINSGDDNLPHPADSTPPAPPFPHIYARLSEEVVERIELPDDSSVRLSQGVVEHIELPNNEIVRCSEMIIEIIQKQPVGQGGGWVVKEA